MMMMLLMLIIFFKKLAVVGSDREVKEGSDNDMIRKESRVPYKQ